MHFLRNPATSDHSIHMHCWYVIKDYHHWVIGSYEMNFTWAFLNLLRWYLPAVWATKVACFPFTAMKSWNHSPVNIKNSPLSVLLRNWVSQIDCQQVVRLITLCHFTPTIAQTYHKGNVIDFDVVQRPSSEEFDFRHRFSHPWIYVSCRIHRW